MKSRFHFPKPGVLVVLALSVAIAGCAKQMAESPPAPADAPPVVSQMPVDTLPVMVVSAQAPEPVAVEVLPAVDPAFFRFDSYMLDAPAREALDLTASLMRKKPAMRITIEGHCDERGATEYNVALGERRALAARDYLVASGVKGERIRVLSFGKERPFASGHDETAWSQNRRAQVIVRDAQTGALTTDSSK